MATIVGMDYEFRIKVAERELAHLIEMKTLQDGRPDANDKRLDAIQHLAETTANTVDNLAVKVDILASKADLLVTKLDSVVEAMLHTCRN
ncbi:MAG: hypothetical protein M3Y57_09065 [Acidobacteriota bacterium]|nr:hypothetical protein [Acidobacteriota bacterium]